MFRGSLNQRPSRKGKTGSGLGGRMVVFGLAQSVVWLNQGEWVGGEARLESKAVALHGIPTSEA